MITSNIDFSPLIGKHVKDENSKEFGKIVSFLVDSSGQVEEALIENRNEDLLRYSVERLKINQDEISLTSDIEKRAEILSEKFPLVQRKRKVLDKLSENDEILPEIYEDLCAEFDKALKEMKGEAQNLSGEIDKEVQVQEDSIKMLQMARTFLEIEHGVGNVKDEVYQQSLVSILKEIKNASYKKLNLLKTKDKITGILTSGEEMKANKEINKDQTDSMIEATGQRQVVTVRMTQE